MWRYEWEICCDITRQELWHYAIEICCDIKRQELWHYAWEKLWHYALVVTLPVRWSTHNVTWSTRNVPIFMVVTLRVVVTLLVVTGPVAPNATAEFGSQSAPGNEAYKFLGLCPSLAVNHKNRCLELSITVHDRCGEILLFDNHNFVILQCILTNVYIRHFLWW